MSRAKTLRRRCAGIVVQSPRWICVFGENGSLYMYFIKKSCRVLWEVEPSARSTVNPLRTTLARKAWGDRRFNRRMLPCDKRLTDGKTSGRADSSSTGNPRIGQFFVPREMQAVRPLRVVPSIVRQIVRHYVQLAMRPQKTVPREEKKVRVNRKERRIIVRRSKMEEILAAMRRSLAPPPPVTSPVVRATCTASFSFEQLNEKLSKARRKGTTGKNKSQFLNAQRAYEAHCSECPFPHPPP